MSLLHLSAKPIRVWISDSEGNRPAGYPGTGAIEITDLVVDFSTEDEPLDVFSGSGSDLRGGLVQGEATLTIAGSPPLGSIFTDADLETRGNALWNAGNRVDVQIALSDGTTFVPFPRGALRIQKKPNPPRQIREETQIELKCDLAWLNRDDAPESNSDITLNPTGSTPSQAINLLAARVGLPPLITDISTPLIRKIPPRQGGSRVDQIGAIAFPTLHWIWEAGDRTLRAFPLNLDASPDFSLNTTLDAEEWDTEIGAVPEPGTVKVRGTKRINVTRTGGEANGAESIENTEVSTSVSSPFGNSTVTNTVVKSKGELFPKEFPGDGTAITAAVTTSVNTFSGNVLTKRVESSSGLKGVILPEAFPGDTSMVPIAQRVTTDWFTGSDGIITKMQVKREELIGTYDSVATPQDQLVTTVKELTIWKLYAGGSGWLEIKTTTDLRERNPASTTINLVDAPPTPETKPQEQESVEVPDEGSAELAAPFPKRVLYLEFRYPTFADGQTGAIAALQGKLRWAAALPATWTMAIPDTMLTAYKPFYIWDWTDIDGAVYRYLSHAHTFEFSQNQAKVSMQGLCLGKVVGGVLVPVWTLL